MPEFNFLIQGEPIKRELQTVALKLDAFYRVMPNIFPYIEPFWAWIISVIERWTYGWMDGQNYDSNGYVVSVC